MTERKKKSEEQPAPREQSENHADLATDEVEVVQKETERELGVSSEIRGDGSIAYFDAEKASLTREVGS